MANKAKKLFVIGSLLAGALTAITACEFNLGGSFDSTASQDSSVVNSSENEPSTSAAPGSTSTNEPNNSSSGDQSTSTPEPVVLTHISATSTKENYEYGEELELVVKGFYSDNSSETIAEYQVEGFNATQSGTQTVTITYGDKTCSIQVVVNERINAFPKESLDSFLLNQTIEAEIPTPVGYEEWTNTTDFLEDGSYLYVASTKDEENLLAEQYSILLGEQGWTFTEEDGVYSASKEEADAQITFFSKEGEFTFQVNYYELYPTATSYASLLSNKSLDNVEKIILGNTQNNFLTSTVVDGKFSIVDYKFSSGQIEALGSNIARFTLKKENKAYTLTDAKGRKLGATDVGQLAYDEGSTAWKIVFNKDNSVVVINADSSKGRLAYDAETGSLTTYLNVVGTNLVYPQLFTLKETPLVYATDISLEAKNTEVGLGKATSLKIKCVPENANQFGEVTWTSSNEEVATVQDGVIRGIGLGEATITATTKSKGQLLTATYDINVVEMVRDEWTLMVYICGSNLESGSGFASSDIREILRVPNQPDEVNIVLETGGTTRWSYPGIAANKLSRYHVENQGIVLDEQLDKQNMGKQPVLESFMNWTIENYPADKYGIIFWNHGGALDGVCFDDTGGSDSLLATEIGAACANVMEAQGIEDKFEFIGYDACLMGVQDIAEINANYFNYMVCSEEVENGDGWTYNGWIDNLYALEDTESILKAACDSFVDNYGASTSNDQTLSCLDLSQMGAYFEAFETFSSLIKTKAKSNLSNFKSLLKKAKCFYDVSDYGLIDAYDAMNKIKSNSSYADYATEIEAVKTAFNNLVIYSRAGRGAGNSYGLALHACVGYYADYPASQTNFNTWRSIFF